MISHQPALDRLVQLTDKDHHYWEPDANMVKALCDRLPDDAKVLEIGPGPVPFPRANVFIDIRDFGAKVNWIKCDANFERLPFDDKEFDFVYARHVLEDMYDPIHLCNEMTRVAKSGFIETPSPIAEFSRGVDGGSPAWRGYHHHRWLIWAKDGVLHFISKWPVIEYVGVPAPQQDQYLDMLRKGADYWNTRLYWEGEVKYRHIQCPQDFMLPQDYQHQITAAVTDWQKDHKVNLSQPCPWRNENANA